MQRRALGRPRRGRSCPGPRRRPRARGRPGSSPRAAAPAGRGSGSCGRRSGRCRAGCRGRGRSAGRGRSGRPCRSRRSRRARSEKLPSPSARAKRWVRRKASLCFGRRRFVGSVDDGEVGLGRIGVEVLVVGGRPSGAAAACGRAVGSGRRSPPPAGAGAEPASEAPRTQRQRAWPSLGRLRDHELALHPLVARAAVLRALEREAAGPLATNVTLDGAPALRYRELHPVAP